ncbi:MULTISPECIES: hypothetical protein [Paenibacillus]|uniref:hypothetical protein n=1 Tax=Paenibacillus TaxID=44249 RepID=UPI00030F2281|nr:MULTISPECIES: hypothetical protein [Paenibacillus]MCP1425845.1 hypothetical protein [Paenibacillus xylanexedens]
MDLSTWLGIISIVISCIGLLVTVNKVSYRNSHNSNVNGSFNKTKIIDKSKTTYENHNHVTVTPIAQPQLINQDDDSAMKIAGGIAASVVSAILIFYYVKYRAFIIDISSIVMIVGVLTALLVVTLKVSLSRGYKVYILLVWIILSGLMILLNHPIYPPDQLDSALSKFSQIEVSSAPKTLWELHNSNPNASLFLTFQIGGLIMIVFYLATYFKLIYKILASKPLQPIKTLFKGDIMFWAIIFVFISGAAVEFIRFLQNLSV